jgi:LmbE family N-acetylglucosaminyl deacetylase
VNVLVIAPHPDDESIGCGGTIAAHREKGDRVVAVFLTSGELGLKQLPPAEAWRIREGEAAEAANVLGIAEVAFLRLPDWFVGDNMPEACAALRPTLMAEMPKIVYVPHSLEWHPDHKASLLVLAAAYSRLEVETPLIRAYEVWTPLTEYDHVEDISTYIEQKVAAIRCYASQISELHYDRAIEGLNRYRGEMAARRAYAEVFAVPDAASSILQA